MLKIDTLSKGELRNNAAYKNHKKVVRFEDSEVGLKGFVAIFNDSLGSAVGGTRVFPYPSEKAALSDVLNLSRAMTYKCAIANISHGGGKAVIIGDPLKIKTPELLKSYAEVISTFEGEFFTGEDVGLTENDVKNMLKYSPYFIGKPDQAGDPSEYASFSVFVSMQEAVKEVLHKDSLAGLTVGVKGLGKVGFGLVKLLDNAGATIIGSDIDEAVIARIKKLYPKIKFVDSEKISSQVMDIYAPCALGNEFTKNNISKITHAKIICGSANNQLADSEAADLFENRGVLYVPDYLANAGGLINVADELEADGYKKKRVDERIEDLRIVFKNVYKYSQFKKITMSLAADRIAEKEFLKESSEVHIRLKGHV